MTKAINKNIFSSEDKININNELDEDLLSSANTTELFGKAGLFQKLKKQLVNKILKKRDGVSHWLYQAF